MDRMRQSVELVQRFQIKENERLSPAGRKMLEQLKTLLMDEWQSHLLPAWIRRYLPWCVAVVLNALFGTDTM